MQKKKDEGRGSEGHTHDARIYFYRGNNSDEQTHKKSGARRVLPKKLRLRLHVYANSYIQLPKTDCTCIEMSSHVNHSQLASETYQGKQESSLGFGPHIKNVTCQKFAQRGIIYDRVCARSVAESPKGISE